MKSKLLLFILATLTFFFVSIFISYRVCAQTNQWNYYTPFPEGGHILDLCVDNNNTLYALTSHWNMIFYSTDGGQNWNRIPGTQSQWNATCINYNNATNTLYVGTLSAGVRWTSNLGQSWSFELFYTNTTSGQSAYIAAIGINPITNTVLCFEPTFGSSKFYRTQNNFATWTTITNASFASALDIKYFSDGNVYASTANGVFKSTNNATSWTALNMGMTSLETTCIEEKTTNGYYFAGVDANMALQDSSNTGVYRSTNGGVTWAAMNTGLACKIVEDIEIASNGKIYAATIRGIFESFNDGATWTRIDNGLQNKNVWNLAKDGNGNLFSGSMKSGIAVTSTSGAANWSYRNNGLKWNYLMDMHIDANGKIFAMDASLAGVFYKNNLASAYIGTDSGTIFTVIGPTAVGFSNDVTTGLRIVRSPNGSLFASYRHKFEMLFRSDDDGISWVNATGNMTMPTGANYGSPEFIVFDPAGTVYLAVNYSTSGAIRSEVFKSTNNGVSWTSIFQGGFSSGTLMITGLDITPTGIPYLTTSNIAVSHEIKFYNGIGWTVIPTTGMTAITSLLLFIDNNNTLYVRKNNNSIYRLQGASWVQVTIPWATGGKLFFDNNNNIYATETINNGIYFSDNAGATWTNITAGIPSVYNFSTLVPLVVTDMYFDQNNVAYLRSGPNDNLNYAGIYSYTAQSPLALQLINFEGRKISENNILLNWETAHEKNVEKFLVERMQDFSGNFETIAEAKAKNNESPNNYAVHDDDFDKQATKTYRLKTVHYDGRYNNSKTVTIKGKKKEKMKVYPNPLSGNELTIIIDNELLGKSLSFVLYDITGRNIHAIFKAASNQMRELKMDLLNVTDGMYLLKCCDENGKLLFAERISKL